MVNASRECEACQHPFASSALFCPKCGQANLIGQIAGSYRLTKRLGAGGMGVVYLAEHVKLGTLFAVKVLHRDVVRNQLVAQRFLKEAKATSLLRHEHIIFLADYGELEGISPYIAMEFLEGEPLQAVLEKTPLLPVSRVFSIIAQLCETMTYAHTQGIVHRDLKPDNLFLLKRHANQQDFLKVLDFGIAKLLETEEPALTKTGALLGTPHYVSPEQVLGKGVDATTDIFATGVILFQMLTGRFPFDGNSLMEILSVRLLQKAPLLGEMHPAWQGSAVEALVADALCMNKAERLPSMQHFYDRLLAAKEDALAREQAARASPRSSTRPASLVEEVSLPTSEGKTPKDDAAISFMETSDSNASLPNAALPSKSSPRRAASQDALVASREPSSFSSETLSASSKGAFGRWALFLGLGGLFIFVGWFGLRWLGRSQPSTPPNSPMKQSAVPPSSPTKQSVVQHPAPSLSVRAVETPPKSPKRPPSETTNPALPSVGVISKQTEDIKKQALSSEEQTQKRLAKKMKASLVPENRPHKKRRRWRVKEREAPQPRQRIAEPRPVPRSPSIPADKQCASFVSSEDQGRWVFFRVQPPRVQIAVEGGGRIREKKTGGYCLLLPPTQKIQITISPEDDTLARCIFEHFSTNRFFRLIRLKDAEDSRSPSDCYRN